jgi:hypothetical protein
VLERQRSFERLCRHLLRLRPHIGIGGTAKRRGREHEDDKE